MMLDMAIKELGRHRTRTLLTIVGIAIGIVLVTTLSSFSAGIDSIIEAEMSFISGKIIITQEGIGWENFFASEIDESIIEELEGMSGVERVGGVLASNVPEIGAVYAGDVEDFDMFDIDLDFYIRDGRYYESGADELILGSIFAEVSGYQVGDELEIRGKKYEIVGEMKATGSGEDSGVMASLETGQEILKLEDKLTMVMVQPSKVEEAKAIAEEIDRAFEKIDAFTDEDAREQAAEFTGQISMMTFAMGSIAAFIAGLGIMNVMFMSVRERQKEIGTMKALGATTYQILLEVVMEAVIISLIGAGIAILLSYLAVDIINAEMGTMGIAKITPGLLINVTLFAVFLGVLGGFLPARQAAKLDPAEVLRYE
jgi:putative ABC transport system permease protein